MSKKKKKKEINIGLKGVAKKWRKLDAPTRLVKSYKHHMVGGESVLPWYVASDSSTEPLVNAIHGWGKWWGSEGLESSGGLSKADLVSLGQALCSQLHTISPFFLLQTQKEGNNNIQESWMNQESHSWQESPHSCLVCFPAPAASPCSVLMLDAILQKQILFLPPCVFRSLAAGGVHTLLRALTLATPRWGVLPTLQTGIWEAGNMAAWCTRRPPQGFQVSLNSNHSSFFLFCS